MIRTEAPNVAAPSRWKWYVSSVFVGLLVMIWAAPIVVGYTPLVGRATAAIEAHLDGKVQVGGVSLGWFSPIVLYDVVVRDADNQVLAHIPHVEGDRALFKLLLDPNDLGSYRLDKAAIDIHCRGNTSNLEQVFAKALNEPAPSSSAAGERKPLPQLHLETVNATLTIHDDDTRQDWKMSAVSLSGRILDQGKTVQLNVHSALHDGSEPGSLKLEINVQNVLDPTVHATAKGQFTSLPIAMANVIVRRYQPGFEATGSLQGNFQIAASLKGGKPEVQALGEIVGNQITLSTPQLADTLRVQRMNIPCTIRLEDGKLVADRLEIQSEFGKASVHGSIDLERDLLSGLDQAGFELALDVNLATLAERLPRTLHVRRDLQLTAGQLQVKCRSVASNGTIVWQGKLHTSDVRGVKGQQTIAWTHPITLEFQARDLHKGVPILDSIHCSARFLRIDGTQTAEQFTLSAEADLQQLAEPLGQFIDLDTVKLAGRANGKLVVRHVAKDQFTLNGDAQFQNMNFAWFTKHAWQEPMVAAKFEARGSTDRAGKTRLDQGNFEVRLGDDSAVAQLAEPIADLANGPWGTVALIVEGDLSRWRQRARSWTTALDEYQLAGSAKLQLRARASTAAIELTGVNLQASDVRCTSSSLWIHEPNLTLTTAGRWSTKAGHAALTQTKLNCATVQVDAAALAFTPSTMALRGNAYVSGDLARLRKWTHDPKAKPGEPMSGAFAGRIDLARVGDRLAGDVNLTVKHLVYGPTLQPIWREAEVKCVGNGGYDLAKDKLTFSKLRLVGATFSADAAGTIADLRKTTDVEVAGSLTYDLERLEPQLRTLLGKNVKIVGKDTRAFKVAGPLYPINSSVAALRFVELKGDASVNWQSLKALGCDVGAAEMRAILQKGWFQLYPIETTLNRGKLRIQPNIRLDPEPTEMILLAGPVIEKAQITPEMFAGALAYALPALANVAEAEGTISLALDGGRLPLAAPTTGELKGTITLHAGKLGAGPVVRELSGLLRVPPPTSLIKESKVPFHMVAGKVHHRDLELVFPDYTLKSSGAVGMDGSLALVVEMSIPPQLASALKLTPAQAKQLLRIPVGGTLERPRPDPRALESLTAIVGRSFLENQLNKLLQPKR